MPFLFAGLFQKISQLDPHFLTFGVPIGVAAQIEADKCEAFALVQ